MKKRFYGLVSLLLAVALIVSACGSGTGQQQAGGETGTGGTAESQVDYRTDLQIGTGSTGGTYFPLGQEIANVLNDHVQVEGFNSSAVATGASVDNLAKIGRGELQLGLSVHLTAWNAVNGKGEFEGAAIKNVGFMGHIYPEVMQVVTLKSKGITSIADLKGKKVAIGPAGSGTQAAAKLVLEAYGIKDGDYEAYQEGFGDAKGKLQDGVIDATFGLLGLPASSIDELQAQTQDVKYLPIEGEALQYVEEHSQYKSFEIPGDSYEWLGSPVNTISAYAVLVGSTTQVSDELGYEITKALFENASQITHQQGKNITKENALRGSDGLPLHPGAEKYFKEAGILK
ncbi:TAXI family TRAP transporter solute-binding subunit [Brevibacillus humidisoli]|nr:TAXI family TRAP transporter solute-binding subunit [Brevibacillus humidisoli]UFJ43414.1 TAXI family TRAP transporter solute-binding subunit [Brevibacillus humidisoli]